MADTTNTSDTSFEPSDVLIARFWRRWQILEAMRRDCRARDAEGSTTHIDYKLRALALMLASIPATTWGDLMPKVVVQAFLRDCPEVMPSHQASMLEAAITCDTDRLQRGAMDVALH